MAAWWMWGATLFVCLLPVDISLRHGEALTRPKLVETEYCGTTRLAEANFAGLLVCIPNAPPLYSAPRWVLVW